MAAPACVPMFSPDRIIPMKRSRLGHSCAVAQVSWLPFQNHCLRAVPTSSETNLIFIRPLTCSSSHPSLHHSHLLSLLQLSCCAYCALLISLICAQAYPSASPLRLGRGVPTNSAKESSPCHHFRWQGPDKDKCSCQSISCNSASSIFFFSMPVGFIQCGCSPPSPLTLSRRLALAPPASRWWWGEYLLRGTSWPLSKQVFFDKL